MIANRPDWCISRQRTWGVPITLFVNKQTGEPHPDTERLLEEVAKRVEKQGIDAWFSLEPSELLGDAAADGQPGAVVPQYQSAHAVVIDDFNDVSRPQSHV